MAGPCWNIPSPVARSVFPPNEVQLDLFQRVSPAERVVRLTGGSRLLASENVVLAGLPAAVDYVRHPRARVYRLMLRRDGTARVTVPRHGSLTEARNFLLRHTEWLAARIGALRAARSRAGSDPAQPEIRYRGELRPVTVSADARTVLVGDAPFPMPRLRTPDPVARAEAALRRLAAVELPSRVGELASLHGIPVTRVSVRNQRTRWGSCSARGVISLNWRLVQVPESVRDYVLLHELAHRRHLNHSERFWDEVRRLCPGFEQSERWLREHSRTLL